MAKWTGWREISPGGKTPSGPAAVGSAPTWRYSYEAPTMASTKTGATGRRGADGAGSRAAD